MSRQTHPTAVVFDFDGTLADSFLVALAVFDELRGHRPFPQEDVSRLRNLPLRGLLRELGIPLWKVPLFMWRARRVLHSRVGAVELIPGMAEAVRALNKRYQLYVVSSNSAENIRTVLERTGIADCFRATYGNAGALHKERALKRLMRRYSLNAEGVWYVGDEARDIEAARRAGVHAVAVSWGFSNIHILEQMQPERLVFSPDELVDALHGGINHA